MDNSTLKLISNLHTQNNSDLNKLNTDNKLKELKKINREIVVEEIEKKNFK